LYDLAVFRSVTTELVGDGALRDLVLTVSEKPRWAFETGVGLATDQGVRTFGRVGRRNLFGHAHRLELYGQVGLDWRTESLLDWLPDIRSPEWRFVAQYHAPGFPVRSQDLAVDLLLGERRVDRTWSMDRNGAGLSHTTRFGDTITVVTSARVEQRQLEEVDVGALLDGEAWEVLLTADPSLPTVFRPQELASLVLLADGRNDPVLPTRGALLSLSAELAPGLVQVDDLPTASFVKTVGRANAYASLPFVTWHVAAEGGFIGSLDGAPPPLEDRFVLGGTASLRGFRRQSLGPRNLVPLPDIPWPDGLDPVMVEAARDEADRWVPTGGDVLASATIEALVPFPVLGLSAWDGYALAGFADAGNAWLVGPGRVDTDGLDLPALRVGSGVGLRAATPVGPLQFDVAVNVAAVTSTSERRVLLVDAFDEPSARVHLSLGAL
jgi:outer membrane protein assembly factor BamA